MMILAWWYVHVSDIPSFLLRFMHYYFSICIDTFFIHVLHSPTVAPSHSSIIHAPPSYTALDTPHLCIALISHSCVALIFIHAPQSYTVLDTLYLYVTLISHSCIAFFHYLCIIYTASWSLACFFSFSCIRSSFWLLNEEMQVDEYKALILPHRCLLFSLVLDSLNIYFISLFLYNYEPGARFLNQISPPRFIAMHHFSLLQKKKRTTLNFFAFS